MAGCGGGIGKRLQHPSPKNLRDGPENLRDSSKNIHDSPEEIHDSPKDIHDSPPGNPRQSEEEWIEAPAALPAAPSVVAIVTNRQITISTIPYIIIYIRAVTL